MLKVEDYARIRRAFRDGMSIRAIARTFHHTRRKIREVLQNPEPKPYTRIKEPASL
jgi:DNA invertase Pin-like site-specific DNA recombinase